jgi:hypothetical protein
VLDQPANFGDISPEYVPAAVVGVVSGAGEIVVEVVTGPGGRTLHPVGLMMVSLSSVTAPALPAALAANSRPVTVVPVAPTSVIDADAKIVPTNVVAELSVAELPTVQ